jgi:hypothetical protein
MSEVVVRYRPSGMIADIIFPRVAVKKESDKYYIWNKGDLLRPVDDVRADGTPARLVDFASTTGSYLCVEHALKAAITQRQRDNADSQLNLETTKVQGIAGLIDIARERRVLALIAGGTVPTAAAQAVWDHASATKIESDIDIAKEKVRAGTGGIPANTIAIPAKVATAMKKSGELRELIKYTQAGLLVNGDLPPVLFGLKVAIGGMVYETAKKGQTQAYAQAWDETVLVAYVNPVPSIDSPSFGYSFNAKRQTRRWRDEEIDADMFEVQDVIVEKLVCVDAGATITNCMT